MTTSDQQPRPAYAGPDVSTEGWDDTRDRPINVGVRWDLSFGCTVSISHDHAHDDDPEQWTATVAMSDNDLRAGTTVRTVTIDQVEHYARLLLDLTARHRRAQQTALNAAGHGAR